MRDPSAPRGRRALLRGLALALLAIVAPGTATGAVAAEPAAPTVTVFDGGALPPDAFALPDGALAGVAYGYGGDGSSFVEATRIEADGTVRRTVVPPLPGRRGALWLTGAVRPLTDGTVGVVARQAVARRSGDLLVVGVELLRLDGAGAVVARTALPASARGANGFALEADGTVWWARACRDRLYRRTSEGTVAAIRLPRHGCRGGRGLGGPERATALAVGADGAVWMVNLCRRRIVRLGADGRLRQWTPDRGRCVVRAGWDEYVDAPLLTVDPRGGIAYYLDVRDFGRPNADAEGGRVLPDGTLLTHAPTGFPGFIAADGSAWLHGARVGPGGRRAQELTLPGGRTVLDVEPARGGAWLIGGRGTFHDEYKSSSWSYDEMAVALLGADGTRADWPLTALLGAEAADKQLGEATLGADGALWLTLWGGGADGARLLRVVPPTPAPPTTPDAVPSGGIARAGRLLTLPLACRADPGRWCSGSVTLSTGAAPVRFLVAGQQRAGIRLTLDGNAARTLRDGGVVEATATVASDGAGTVRPRITVR
ncbi:MAG TPA: hypothetical protein VLK58_27875 [Conexibacter sp.]|nr:hypothetical protein [Conexibacter sp.]